MIERVRFSPKDIGRVHVLIFEPEQNLRSLLRGILLSMGAREITTAGSIERLREVQRNNIDLVFLRLTQDMMGEGLVRSVRRGSINIKINAGVIAYAPDPTINLVKSALYAGADEIIVLPFTGRSVMGKVNAVLTSPKPLVQINGHIAPDHTDAIEQLDAMHF